jgi:hypothetical protein
MASVHHKLDLSEVAEVAPDFADSIGAHQVAVYVMCGGGWLGESAARRPAGFYIDDRCGKLPYPRRSIMQAVDTLATIAKANGLDPNNLPEMPRFHNCGVF